MSARAKRRKKKITNEEEGRRREDVTKQKKRSFFPSLSHFPFPHLIPRSYGGVALAGR
jgi:hypothetical protein